jgi:mono/diheme cytochrome c family protein
MNLTKLGIRLIAVLCVVALGAVIFAWRPAIAPIDPPKPGSFDPALVKRGAQLAALGDCDTCHTAPGGKVFAGGLGLPTPFGTIYSSNITPDPETGIGRWSQAALRRAMREGVDRQGRYLYPAFPYDHFTLVTDEDNDALYAYLMTLAPVAQTAPPNALPFPINIRMVLAGWNLLFLHQGPYKPDPTHDETWNRGAYLVEGLGHCGACHTPRNALGAERRNDFFGGGEAEGWHAFTINAASQSPVPWTQDALYTYLRTGYHGLHGVARGPMGPVVGNLAQVDDSDLKAMATYVAAVMGKPEAAREAQAKNLAATARTTGPGTIPQSGGFQTVAPADVLNAKEQGAAIYAATCATCHESGRPVPYGGIGLQFSTAVSGENSRNLINLVLNGLPASDGTKGPVMPGFAGAMNNDQIAALATYLRGRFADGKPAWPDLPKAVADARRDMSHPQPAAGAPAAAPNAQQ